ncbi:TetR/AcrR family transcriptional regulator [Leucobacter luti]|uniref:TetR/AcrR family transcriptional regulator n=1 Tax=Leucobacter luti TaxID=340320 RepID=UPI003D03988E
MSETTRDHILAACARVISRAGLTGFRMSDVAREAGVSIGLLPYHFGDRDGLLQAALDHVNEGTADRAARIPSASSPGGRLEALLCSEFGEEAAIREGSIAWNELRAKAVFSPAQADAVARSTGRWQAEARALIAEAAPDRDADALALILTALVEGLSGRWLTGQISSAAAQEAVRDALSGLGFSARDGGGDDDGADPHSAPRLTCTASTPEAQEQ